MRKARDHIIMVSTRVIPTGRARHRDIDLATTVVVAVMTQKETADTDVIAVAK